MNLLFANIGWLSLLALIAVPLIAHLVAKRRPKVRAFPSLLFLKRVMKKSARYRKPQDWLLLALRTLAVLGLVVAFLHPLLTNLQSDATSGNQRTVVLVVDVSASMAASGTDGRRMDIALEQAIRLLSDMKPSRANVVLVGAQAEAIFPEPGPNLKFLISELKAVNVRPEPAAIRSSLRLAADQLSAVKGEKEIFIISDFQASAWKDQSLPGGIPVKTIRCGDETPPNVAITDLLVMPAEPVIGEEVEIQCRLSNFSDEARVVPVVIEVGGRREARDVNLAANGQGQFVLRTAVQRPGMIKVRAELGGDPFIGDNVRQSVLEVKPARRMLVVLPQDDVPVPAALDGVARALPWLEVDAVGIDQLDSEQITSADYLFVWQWDGRQAELLGNFANAGVSLIVSPAGELSGSNLKGFFANLEGTTLVEESGDAPWSVECQNLDSEVYRLFRNGQFGAPLEGEVTRRIRFPSSWLQSDGLSCWARYSDGSPALLARENESSLVMLWNLPLLAGDSTLTARPSFVVFFGEFLKNFRLRGEMQRRESLPGFPVSWELPEETDLAAVGLVFAEDQSKLEIRANSRELTSQLASRPGLYQWTVSGQPVEQIVVNFPSSESDLKALADNTLAGGEALAASEVDRFTALREGRPLWPWCLAFSLFCLAVESYFAAGKPSKSSESLPTT